MAKGGSSGGGSRGGSSSSSSKSSSSTASKSSSSTASKSGASSNIVSNAASKGLAPGYALNKNTGQTVASSVAARNAETAAKVAGATTGTQKAAAPVYTFTANGKTVNLNAEQAKTVLTSKNFADYLSSGKATFNVNGKAVDTGTLSKLSGALSNPGINKNSNTVTKGTVNNKSSGASNYGSVSTAIGSGDKTKATNEKLNIATPPKITSTDVKKGAEIASAKKKQFDKMAGKETPAEGEKKIDYVFGADASKKGNEYQAQRNADIAKKVEANLAGKTFATEAEKKEAIKSEFTKLTGVAPKAGDKNRDNTMNKITEQVNVESKQGDLMNEEPEKEKLAEAEVDYMQEGERLNTEANKLADQYKKDLDALTKDFEEYKNTAKGDLAQNITDRLGNIGQYETSMKENNKLIDDSNQRIIRLQSNEAQQGLMRQYVAKGMTEEEARAQAQADLNKQIMNERQTLLQAQKDSAELNNSVAQRAANAKELIQQAKANNIQYDVGLENTINQMYQNATNAKFTAENNNFTNYVANTALKAYADMTDIEKNEFMQLMGVNLADKNVAYGVERLATFLGPDGIKKNASSFKAAIDGLKNGSLTYDQALQKALAGGGSGTGGGTGGSSVQKVSSADTQNAIARVNAGTAQQAQQMMNDPSFSKLDPSIQAAVKSKAAGTGFIGGGGSAGYNYQSAPQQTGGSMTGAGSTVGMNQAPKVTNPGIGAGD